MAGGAGPSGPAPFSGRLDTGTLPGYRLREMRHTVVLLVVVAGLVAAGETGITNRIEPTQPWDTGRRAVLLVPGPEGPACTPEPKPLPTDSGWTLVDSLALRAMLPAGERLAVRFDRQAEGLSDTLLPGMLTPTAQLAVEVAPDWLKDDLADKFRRLGSGVQDSFGDMIVNCPDKRYYDELCFQVAHLAPTAFLYLPTQLLVDNVEAAYDIAPELQYVDIVDHGDPLQGGDYWSTTKYRAVVNDDTTWVEVPRDVYYWWIIHPKITDEQVKYVSGWFWRGFLFTQCDSGYPLLREKLAETTVLWDGERHRWTNRNQGYPDTLPAVAVVSRWVAHTLPRSATPPRPIQPIEIAQDHDGNCGEVQDLLCAAARTALIPCGGVLDINEDHVWCEIWWQDEFHPWQVDLGGGATNIKNPGIAYDKHHGGGKNCSAIWDWRNDGWQRSEIPTYSEACTLTVEVRDADLRPVDGAIVKLQSEGWQTSELWNCFYGVTDRTGRYTTTLGDWQDYYLDVMSDLGRHSPGLIIDSAGCAPGTHFFLPCTLAGQRESLLVTSDSGTPLDRYRVDVSYTVERESYYGYDCYNASGANEYALVRDTGYADFLMLGEQGFSDYVAGEACGAFVSDEDCCGRNHSLVLTRDEDLFCVWSNEEQVGLTALVDLEVKLYRQGSGVAEPGGRLSPTEWLLPGPTVFSDRLELRLGPRRPPDARVEVLDRSGRVVSELPVRSGTSLLCWGGEDSRDRRVPSGVYFLRASGGGASLCRPVVFLGGR